VKKNKFCRTFEEMDFLKETLNATNEYNEKKGRNGLDQK